MTEAELDALRQAGDFLAVRELPDGSVAGLQRLMYTTSLVLGVDEFSWRYRFCYRDPLGALADFVAIQGERDVPDGPWVACRPEVRLEGGRYPTPAELRDLRARLS